MKPTFLKHLAVSLLGASTARALSFIMIPFAARLYGKDAFGGLALVVGFVGLIQPFLTWRYDIAVVLVRSPRAARALVCGLLGIAVVGYALVTLFLMAVPSFLGRIVDPNLVANLRGAVLLHLAGVVLNSVFAAWLQRHRAFGIIALSQFAGALVTAVLVLGAPHIIGASLTALVWAYALGVLSTTLVLTIGSAGTSLFVFQRAGRIRQIIGLLKKYRVYPTFSLPLTVSSLVSDRVLLLYVTSAFSLGTLGGFYSARQVLFSLVHLTTGSINQVVFPYVNQSAKSVVSLRGPILNIAKGIAVVAGLGVGWLFIYSSEVALIFFGHDWVDVAPMVPWIAAHGAAVSVIGWQGRLLDVDRRQRLDAMLQMAADLALIAAIVALFLIGVSVTTVIATVSLIGIAHAALWLVIVYYVTRLGVSQALFSVTLLVASASATASLALVCKEILGTATGGAVSLATVAFSMAAAVAVTAKSIHGEAAWEASPVSSSLGSVSIFSCGSSAVQIKPSGTARIPERSS